MKLSASIIAILSGCLLSFAALAKSVSVNVFALPSADIEQTVASVSDKLKQNGMESFYEQGFPVHITLYLTTYDEAAIPGLLAKVEMLTTTQPAVPLKAEGFTVTAGNWVFVDAVKETELQQLADKLTNALSPLRDLSAPLPAWVNAYPQKKAVFELYGSPNVFAQFEPHMTLLAAEASPALPAMKKHFAASPPSATGYVKAVGVGLADAKGQITKVLGHFPLKQP